VLCAVAGRKVPEVTVIGHTDTTGPAANNYRLGLDRAQTVKTLLIRAGLDANLVEVESHGEADLLQKTPDSTAEPRNRRVEITIR
jgi:outer membrane protein OmpA-like peptidoglycan-associated protein